MKKKRNREDQQRTDQQRPQQDLTQKVPSLVCF